MAGKNSKIKFNERKSQKMNNLILSWFLLILGILATIVALLVYFLNPVGSGLASGMYVLFSASGICATFIGSLGVLGLPHSSLVLQAVFAIIGFFILIIGGYVAISIFLRPTSPTTGRGSFVLGLPPLTGLFLINPLKIYFFPKKKKRRRKLTKGKRK